MLTSIVFHSAREGRGKTTLTLHTALLLGARGHRVGIIDADVQTGSLHRIFGLSETTITSTFNDYLAGTCSEHQVVYPITPPRIAPPGSIILVPASSNPSSRTRVLQQGYDIERITDGLWDIATHASLEVLLLDVHSLLLDQTLLSVLSLAICTTLVVVLGINQNDFQGTGVLIDVARRLEVPRIVLAANEVPRTLNEHDVRTQLEATYQCPVAGIFPYAEELSLANSSTHFVLSQPQHPLARRMNDFVSMLLAPPPAT